MSKRVVASIFVLLIIIIFHSIGNYLWIKEGASSYQTEKFEHLARKNTIFYSIKEIFLAKISLFSKFIAIFKLLNIRHNWPPLFHIHTAFMNILFNNTTKISLLSNIPFFILIIIFTFLIGKIVAGYKEGLLAAFLISMYPGIFGMSRSYGIDFPAISMVAVSIYFLIRSHGFKNFKYTAFFGICLGLSVLIRAQTIFFLLGPLFYTLVIYILRPLEINSWAEYSKRKDALKPVLNFVFALSIAIIISSFWWKGNLKFLLQNFFMHATRPVHKNFWIVEPFTFNWLFFYLYATIHNISLPLFFLLLISFSSFLDSKIKFKSIIILWMVVPYLINTFILLKWDRYYFPAFPAFALIAAIGILNIRFRKIKFV